MKLINSSWEILEQKPGLEGIYEAIETAGRTCYKSSRPEGKTAKDFVDMLIKRGHLSPLEHGTIYLEIPGNYLDSTGNAFPFGDIHKYWTNSYSIVNITSLYAYITTNYRVLYENNWLDDLEYLCEPTEYHEKRVGVKVNCSIGISREWNRHRTFSICEQSTRYCNYSKDKFGNELTFIIPTKFYQLINEWSQSVDSLTKESYSYIKDTSFEEHLSFLRTHDRGWVAYEDNLERCELDYIYLVNEEDWKPQHAREVLPLATATEVVYTGYTSDWAHFFQMRCDNAAHPDMKALAIPLKEEFIKRGYIE